MKMFAIAAGLVTLTGTAPMLVAPAAAQHRDDHRSAMRHGPAHHRHCAWQMHHHHRVRVCR